MKEPRLQLNIRIEQEDLDAIEEIRKSRSPIPSVTDVVKEALREMRNRVRKKMR